MGILTKLILCLLAYLTGLAISDVVLQPQEEHILNTTNAPSTTPLSSSSSSSKDLLSEVTFHIHRNGEPDICGSTTVPLKLRKSSSKYQLDHDLTKALSSILPQEQCGVEQPPPEIKGHKRVSWGRGMHYNIEGITSQFLWYCDMGQDHTTILPDHNQLVSLSTDGVVSSLPCHFHTREGLRLTSYKQLLKFIEEKSQGECRISAEGTEICTQGEVHLYAVPAGRPFMFAPSYIGETFDISHVNPVSNLPISLVTMSLSPKVFDILNFFDKNESDSIVDKALKETSETHRIKRSSTGASGYNLNSQRTSENGFDTHGKTAMVVKKRCLEVLGSDTYIESFTDGLQVLRYNKTTAYIPHMDWIDDPHKREIHDFDSAKKGTNRFATILLYMSDLGEKDGGETVFKNAWPLDVPEAERKSRAVALEELRSSGETMDLKRDSWEEYMVADCRSRLAVRPHSARAVLFYSQHPNGEEDTSSLHGGCPVLHGEKWAANLWVWNGPRGGFEGAPKNKGKEEKVEDNGQIHATFVNSKKDPVFAHAKLYFQDTFWGHFSHEDPPLSVNTFAGHEWNIKRSSDGALLKQIVIKADKKTQRYVV